MRAVLVFGKRTNRSGARECGPAVAEIEAILRQHEPHGLEVAGPGYRRLVFFVVELAKRYEQVASPGTATILGRARARRQRGNELAAASGPQ
jgi:hypothetical protein